MITLLFSTRRNPFSAAIRLFTWSRWSHVALIDGDHVIEAVFPRVRRIPLVDAMRHAARCELVRFRCDDAESVLKAAREQIGKPYDWTALFGVLLRRDWQEPDSWFCSELVAWAFGRAGEPKFRSDRVRRVMPEHLWMLQP